MMTLWFAISLAMAVDSPPQDPAFSIGEKFIGNWQLTLETDASTFGARSGGGDGYMNCEYGPEEAWVDCVMQASYENMGGYSLKIVLFRMSDPSRVGAFVTNSWGGGRMYHGALPRPDQLVFEDAFDDPGRKWRHQRTIYGFDEHDGIRFSIDVSSDGENYLPHSGGVYHRIRNQSHLSTGRR